jgi:predicted regulator of Ras-like GTPase activity (Roadblock/LC7/MglB family)
LAFVDSSDNGTHKESVDDLAALFAGTGIKAASAVLSLDVQELSQAAVASGDFFVIEDATDNSTKKESVDDLATLFAGTGLAAASAVLSLDLNELSAAAVDVASDSIAIIDANDSNGSKKESIADLVSAMAGSGLSASGGQLSTQGSSVALKADVDTLAEGYNYFATISGSNVGVDLPAAPSVGDVVHVKAGDIQTDHVIRISTQGSHAIDGEANISLESPFAAVSLVYVVANAWRIV